MRRKGREKLIVILFLCVLTGVMAIGSTAKAIFHVNVMDIGALMGFHTDVVSLPIGEGDVSADTGDFFDDQDIPERGAISVVSPQGILIDGRQWFDKDDIITFRVDCFDVETELEEISMDINGQTILFEMDEILSDDEGDYVLFDTDGIDPDEKHRYTVTGAMTDSDNNILELEPYTVYLDLEEPVISKLAVERKNNKPNKGLTVTPFGTFTNDTLILKAYVADAEYDIGIDYVTVFYDGLSEPVVMIDDGDGLFSAEISSDEEISEYNISVTAYDKFGRSSEICPNLENAATGDLADNRFVMIEKIHPDVTLYVSADEEDTEPDNSMLYHSNRSIELIVQDKESGIQNIGFYVNGIDFKVDKNGVELLKKEQTAIAETTNTAEQSYFFDTDYITSVIGEPKDGIYIVSVRVTDNAGNVSTEELKYFFDNVPPQIEKIAFSSMTVDGKNETMEFVEELQYRFYFKTAFEATVYVTDPEASSGLDVLKYRFVSYENGVKQDEISGVEKIEDGKVKLQVPQDFKGQIIVEAYDNIGNSSGEKTTQAYVVDNTAPEIIVTGNTETPYRDAVGNALYSVDNRITVEIIDTVSGIKEISGIQSAEVNSYDMKIVLDHDSYHEGEDLGEGWIVSAIDRNLVTKVTKTFVFDQDDNNIVLEFSAEDNALNTKESVQAETFTIDKTNPVINISFRDSDGIENYYSQNRIADIVVNERNFDESLIRVLIENTFGAVPSFTFTEQSASEHTAVINFDEGDYTFDVSGTDLADHEAVVNYSGGNERSFFVDKTAPAVEDNFSILVNAATENTFNSDMTVEIKLTEHNFDPYLPHIHITKKNAGETHSAAGLVDATYEVLRDTEWSSSGDVHTISFTVSEDAVYQVELLPVDLAGNAAEEKTSAVFEIDQTAPIVIAKNEMPVDADDTESINIYSYLQENDPAPTIEFDDLNFDHINYDLTVYVPDHTSSEADTVIRPSKVYLEDDQSRSGTIVGSKFVMPDFVEDGVYALQLTAVDRAGNESVLNVNTYARMINQDVLAYIMDSNPVHKTGLYSFQYENGVAISKKPDDFEDIHIYVLAKENAGVDIVLRDSNGDEINTNAQASIEDNVYGIDICDFIIEADFFKENFQDDTDAQLILTVKSGDSRIDLGKMHIDNVAPTCDIPEDFQSWHWYYGEEDRTITISNISELIDEELCKVYDNGKEVPFQYFDEENAIVFTLKKGWHNVGIVLSDVAGNTYYIQEKANIHIGFFWLWMMTAAASALTVLAVCVILYNTRKKRAEEAQNE